MRSSSNPDKQAKIVKFLQDIDYQLQTANQMLFINGREYLSLAHDAANRSNFPSLWELGNKLKQKQEQATHIKDIVIDLHNHALPLERVKEFVDTVNTLPFRHLTLYYLPENTAVNHQLIEEFSNALHTAGKTFSYRTANFAYGRTIERWNADINIQLQTGNDTLTIQCEQYLPASQREAFDYFSLPLIGNDLQQKLLYNPHITSLIVDIGKRPISADHARTFSSYLHASPVTHIAVKHSINNHTLTTDVQSGFLSPLRTVTVTSRDHIEPPVSPNIFYFYQLKIEELRKTMSKQSATGTPHIVIEGYKYLVERKQDGSLADGRDENWQLLPDNMAAIMGEELQKTPAVNKIVLDSYGVVPYDIDILRAAMEQRNPGTLNIIDTTPYRAHLYSQISKPIITIPLKMSFSNANPSDGENSHHILALMAKILQYSLRKNTSMQKLVQLDITDTTFDQDTTKTLFQSIVNNPAITIAVINTKFHAPTQQSISFDLKQPAAPLPFNDATTLVSNAEESPPRGMEQAKERTPDHRMPFNHAPNQTHSNEIILPHSIKQILSLNRGCSPDFAI